MRKISTLIIVFLLTGFYQLQGQVVINEYSCSNLSQYADNYGKYEDWIELYNTGSSPVNLTGYYLSDDSVNNTKWVIPSGISIAAYGYLRFWTSGRDEVSGGNYHTNFKLTQTKNNNEFIVLSNPSATRIDYKEITQETKLGHSIGRTTNGAATWSVFTTPTPNASNNTAIPYVDYASRPNVSAQAGFYPSSISVTLTTTEPLSSIRYTIDGSEPTASSTLYSVPITISSTTVLKAITISTDPTILSSLMVFNTYFINVSHTIPVVSVAAYQLNTLANGTGTLEPIGSFEYFDINKVRKAKSYGGFNRHGQDSWANSQRSLDFVSRDEMGYNYAIKEKLFTYSDRDEYQRIILRAAGDDNYPADHNAANAGSAHLRDAYVHSMAKKGGLNLDVRLAEKAIVYLNGQYWGVYDLRDNPDDHDNTDYYYGQDKYHLQFIETWGSTWAQYGGQQALDDWNDLYTYIMTQDMSVPANYQYVADRYDVTSLVDYVTVNMFSVCSDWLNWNTGWWRGLDSTGTHLKWGYILWDNDATFGHYINYTGIPNTNYDADPCDPESLSGSSDPEGHIQILLRLRNNPEFNQYYITRQFDLWNTVFSCENMLSRLDSVVAVIDPEMTQHSARWGGTYTEWQTNVQQLRDYITQRCPALTNGFIDCYSVTGPYDLTLNTDVVGAGDIKLNTMVIDQFPWTGTYFGDIETLIEAQPANGYYFNHWSSLNSSLSPNATSINVSTILNANDTITAHFDGSSIQENSDFQPNVAALPSVFSDQTTIEYILPEQMTVSMNLFSVVGNEITTVLDPIDQQAGIHSLKLDLSGTGISAGIYLLNFKAGKWRKCLRLVYTPQ